MVDLSSLVFLVPVTLVVLIGVALLTQTKRMSRFFIKAGAGGLEFSVELHELVKREVNKAHAEALRKMAELDKEMIEFWEGESFLPFVGRWEKLNLLAKKVDELEAAFDEAHPSRKADFGMALREVYWSYLRVARDYYASSVDYQNIKQRVLRGLSRLEKLDV